MMIMIVEFRPEFDAGWADRRITENPCLVTSLSLLVITTQSSVCCMSHLYFTLALQLVSTRKIATIIGVRNEH
jgi:hypothetical protein